MPSFTEPNRPLDFLVSEAPGTLSRERVTVAAGSGVLASGRVLARNTSTGKYVPYDNASAVAGVAVADGILAYPVDATADVQATLIVRLAEVKSAQLSWGANNAQGITDGLADLALKYVVARSA